MPSQKKHDGGPAFPRPSSPGDGSYTSDPQAGMTLRDYFAAQAMVGIFAGCSPDSQLPNEATVGLLAYVYADALLAERAKLAERDK